jgi:xanthosine utilization system XapX-like protein
MKIKYGQILLVGILFAIIAQIIHNIGAFLTMSFYTDSNYFSVWSKLMMPTAGPPPLSFMFYGLLFSLITGLLFALVYAVIKKSLPGKTVKKGLMYGFLIFLVAEIPYSLTTILLINLPMLLILYWAIEALIIYLIMGLISAKIIK